FAFPMAGNYFGAMIFQPDAKIIIVARTIVPDGPYDETQSHIIRLNPDGTRDSTFAPAATELGGSYVNQIVLQREGKLLVSGGFSMIDGASRNGFARLNEDGTLDATFDPNREMPNRFIEQMGVQADGKILISGGIYGPPAYRDYFIR